MKISMMEITALIMSLTIQIVIVKSAGEIEPTFVPIEAVSLRLRDAHHTKAALASEEILRKDKVNNAGENYIDENNADVSGNNVFEKHDLDPLVKRFVGDDMVSNRMRRKPPVPSYIWTLYNAIEDREKRRENVVDRQQEIPTIRVVKTYYMDSHGNRPKRLVFKLTRQHKQIQRLEVVLKIQTLAFTSTECPTINIITADNEFEAFQGRRYEDFLIFDVTEVQFNQTLVMEGILHVGDQDFRISRRLEPLLAIFENQEDNPLFIHPPSRYRRDAAEIQIVTPSTNHSDAGSEHFSSFQAAANMVDDFYHCRKYNWTIDMRVFNWNWYAFPATINMGLCSGECPFPLDVEMLNSTNYSFLKNRWRVETYDLDPSVPSECCTPVSYLSQRIIYYSSDHEFVMRNMPNMKVVSCGCR